jgi:hypothetical protein
VPDLLTQLREQRAQARSAADADGTGPPATVLPGGRRRWRWGDVQQWLRTRRESE